MSPSIALKHILHSDAVDATFFGKGCDGYSAFGKTLSRFNYLLFGKFSVVSFRSNWLAILGYLIRHVVSICAEKQVAWIRAWRVVALMQHPKTVRNGAVCQFPCNAMRRDRFAVNAYLPITFSISASLPQPAIVRPKNLNARPKMLFNWWCATKASVMRVYKLNWLTLDIATLVLISFCNWGVTPTPALAFTIGILQAVLLYPGGVLTFLVHGYRIGFFPNSMPLDKTNGFTFCLAALVSIARRNASFLTASTLALTVGRAKSILCNPRGVLSNIFGKVGLALGRVRGMILHVISSLSASSRSQDAPTSLAISIPFTRSIVAQMVEKCNAPVVELSASPC